VEPRRELGAATERESQTVAAAPRIRPQPQGATRVDVLGDEALVSLKAARRKNRRRLRCGFGQANVTSHAHERLGQAARIETLADGARITGVVLDDRRTERLQPRETVVDSLPHHTLERLIATWTLRTKLVPLTEAPDDAAREEHRAARTRSLLVHHGRRAELASAGRRGQTGHAGPRDDYCSANPGLCSTYSVRTRSRPHTKTARVFAASTTLSTISRFSASAMTGSTSSTSTATWFSNGFSGSPGSPRWNSTYAPPTSTRGCPSDGSAGLKPSSVYSFAVCSGSSETSATWSRSYSTSVGASTSCTRPPSPSSSSALGRSAVARSRSETRSATCLKAPCSRGPSAVNRVSFPRRASEPTSVNASCRSMTCIPTCSVRKSTIGSRSATQKAT